jgi:hypothetical protein
MYPDKSAYEVVRISILKNLFVYGALTFGQLESLVVERLRDRLGDSVREYVSVVMQELEAHGEVRRVPHSDPLIFELDTT